MLTADLVRVALRGDVARVRYVDVSDPELRARAHLLCALWADQVGQTRGALDEVVDAFVGDETAFAIVRGLAKLLDDRSTWEMTAPVPPDVVRRTVFEEAAAARPIRLQGAVTGTPRADVLERAASRLGVSPEAIERALYADLKAEQVLVAHDPIDAEALLHRYNVALAQGVLLRARAVHLDVEADGPGALRALFRALKFLQLMHRAERTERGWRLIIDGPLSLFEQSSRYGVQLAMLLPHALRLSGWSLVAEVDWRGDGKLRRFTVGPGDGLVPPGHLAGAWTLEQEETLRRRLEAAFVAGTSPWRVDTAAEVVELGGDDVLVPDFSLRDHAGRCVHVEVVGYWRRGYLERKRAAAERAGVRNLVLCVSRRLATDTGGPPVGAEIVGFAAVVPLGAFLEAAERAAGQREGR